MSGTRFLACWLLAAATLAQAGASDLDTREARLAASLRCVVCQNQALSDSAAPLAADMRRQIREQLAQGRSEQEVRAWFTERYGDAVSYEPPFRPATWLLWLGPFALLAAGAIALLRLLARRADAPQPALTPAERAAARALIEEEAP